MFKDKINIEKLKALAATNVGIGVISAWILIILMSLHVLHKHHAESQESDTSVMTWSTPDSPSHFNKIPASTISDKAFTANNTPDIRSQINDLQQQVKVLQQAIRTLSLNALRKPYQLLGVRQDESSGNWVADIKIDNDLYSVKQGQTLQGWHVVSVDSEGAQID